MILRYFPPKVRWLLRKTLRKLHFFPADLADRVLNRQEPLTPPKSKVYVGDGEFKDIGKRLIQQFVKLGEIQPDDMVLDVGCGIGRAAVPLTKFLTKAGRYHGFDTEKEGIEWCQKQITPLFPNFQFELADVYNKMYNPSGRHAANEYRFPYDNASFDFVFATSVFTHMLPEEVWHYIDEIERVLKPGGRCLATFFLLNRESKKLIDLDKSTLDFKCRHGESMSISDVEPEKAVAYAEQTLRKRYEALGLTLLTPIQYGLWCGREKGMGYQDIVVAKKDTLEKSQF